MKRFIWIGLILIVFCTFVGCQNYFDLSKKPCNQPNTTWISTDRAISFTVSEDCSMYGSMCIDDQIINFMATNDTGAGLHFYPLSVGEISEVRSTEDRYEYFLCSFESKDKFVATVETTTYFQVGQKIILKKMITDNTSRRQRTVPCLSIIYLWDRVFGV